MAHIISAGPFATEGERQAAKSAPGTSSRMDCHL